MPKIDERMVFSVSPCVDGGLAITIGISHKAYENMQDGRCSDLDLSKAIGAPIRLIVFGAKDHNACMKVIQDAAKEANISLLDERRTDFSIMGNAKNKGDDNA